MIPAIIRVDFSYHRSIKILEEYPETLAGERIYSAMSDGNKDPDPTNLMHALQAIVEDIRPEWKGGTVMCAQLDAFNRRWCLWYWHPSFTPPPYGARAESERLTPCDLCGKSLPLDASFWRIVEQNQKLFCSEACRDNVPVEKQADTPVVAGGPWRKWVSE